MQNNELILKKTIYEKSNITKTKYNDTGVDIACRIILFDNNMVMAEEIKTKRLFPIIIEDEFDRVTEKNSDKIVCCRYCIKLDSRNDKMVFFDVIEDFDLEDYINNNEKRCFKYHDNANYKYKQERKLINFFDFIKLMSEKNMYTFGNLYYLMENVGYRYITLDDVIMHDSSDNERTNHNNPDNYDVKALEKFGFDLSSIKQDSFIGREREIKEVIKTIGIKNKSVILVGEPGCGKTALVNDIAVNHMNRFLKGKKIFYINSNSLIEGTKYRGDFEKRLNNVIKICEKSNGNIILFIDEIHTLSGLGASDENKSNDALNILKPYIDAGKVIIIGATTKDEYNEYIATDTAFARRIEKIDIPDFTNDELLIILLSYIRELEYKHNIDLDLDDRERIYVLEELLRITNKNRQKAIDNVKISNPTISKNILENAFAEAIYNESRFVTIDDIYYAIYSHSNLSNTLCDEMKARLKRVITSDRVKKRVRNNIVDFKEAKYSKL